MMIPDAYVMLITLIIYIISYYADDSHPDDE